MKKIRRIVRSAGITAAVITAGILFCCSKSGTVEALEAVPETAAESAAAAYMPETQAETSAADRNKEDSGSTETVGTAEAAGTSGTAADTEAEDNRISINRASEEELMTLDGIGNAKAGKIIEYRNSHGDFKDPEDIKKVPGIKEGTYLRIRDHIKL